jgi:hypothetical protein
MSCPIGESALADASLRLTEGARSAASTNWSLNFNRVSACLLALHAQGRIIDLLP